MAARRWLERRCIPQHHFAHHRTGPAADRLHLPAHARQYDRGAAQQPHTHRPGQRSAGAGGDSATCSQARPAARGVFPGPRHRGGDHRLGGHRADLWYPRPGALFRPGRPQPRLHTGHGGGVLRHPHHPVQLHRGPGIRSARSQGALWISTLSPNPSPSERGAGGNFLPSPFEGVVKACSHAPMKPPFLRETEGWVQGGFY